ncbi:autotransporter outer membrane beta-barrel domain-containing protein [Endozoicomonas numazuensis]|uniref:Autotransporter domain-containing protein n=1 Tax=Endozoicomonas numazuensis TaxID=1137799 RepID=A0A081NFW5_9GAMM|nr:autotransporter outer membrane beta-barrel domain-containing protein [Endozoicomonas numazuensis]KEQ17338.1 hypothetical protein GZ78_16140 [Endozoicomonas numazuensis]
MNNFKRLSASGVLLLQAYGGYAAEVIIPSETDLEVSITGDYGDDILYQPGDTLILPEGNTVSGSGSINDVFKMDINNQEDDEDTTYVEADIIINGDILGGSRNGFEIRDSSVHVDSEDVTHEDILKGNIIINGRIQGDESMAFDMDVAQEGNIIINGIVEGLNGAIDLANKTEDMVGSITNNGKILTASGTGIDSSGVITGGIHNYGLIYAVRAIRFYTENQSSQIINYVRNYNEIKGSITSAYNHHAYIINNGKITGDILFDTDIDLYDDYNNSTGSDTGDGLLDVGNINGTNTLENYGSVNSAVIEATLKNNGQIDVGQLILHGDSYNNNTLNVTQLLNVGTHTFDNTGRLSALQISGSGTINNKGLIYVNKGSELVSNNLNNIGGTIEVNFGDSFSGTGFIAKSISFDDDSKIIIDFDESLFENPQTGSINVMTSTDYNGENVAIERGGLFFEVLNVDYDAAGNSISANIEVLSPQAVVEKHADGGANEALFATSMLSEDGGYSTLSSEYGSIYDITSAEQLNAYINNLMPDARDMHNQVLGNLSSLVFEQIHQRSNILGSGISTGDAPQAYQFWIKGLHGDGDHEETASTSGFDFEIDGFTLGLDKSFDKHTIGAVLNIGNSQIASDREESELITTYTAGVYDIWQHDALYLNSAMSFGVSSHKVSRLRGAAQMSGSYRSSYIDINVQGGYRYTLSDFQFEPLFKLSARWLKSGSLSLGNAADSVTEHHNANLVRQFEAGLGGAISKRWAVKGWVIEPKFSIMHVSDLARDEGKQDITFSGNDYIGLQIDKEHSHLLTSFDIKLKRNENLDVILNYHHRSTKVSSYRAFSVRFDFSF